jgi:cobyrinic acid a,c-diamide synthase
VVRYEDKPTAAQETIADVLKKAMAADPDNTKIENAHKATFSYSYWTQMDALNDHQHTIQLFEAVLQDSASWPVNDIAVKQEF